MNNKLKTTSSIRRPSILEALIPIIILVMLLSANVSIWGDDTLAGSNQIALLLAGAVAAGVAFRLGMSWDDMLKVVVNNIASTMGAILILLLIGSLAGTWLLSGIVPAMIYYGLKILNPTVFLAAACIVSAIVSLATGSSWSTIATVGIALLGIGTALGIGEGLVAGAIISGAYFGDKMSPLSDTTNLAPAMAGTDLITHIKYMALTTVPSISITLIIFIVLGFTNVENNSGADVTAILTALDSAFYISPVLFIVPALVIFMIVKKIPALPALLAGALLGGVFAIIFQPEVVNSVSGVKDDFIKSSYMAVMQSMYGSTSITTSNEMVNNLLSSGGMYGMLNTIWLILCAMIFGGFMEAGGLLKRLTDLIMSLVYSTGSLIASTVGTCIFFNLTASDQYLAIVVPGRMFKKSYEDRNLAPENLSRTLEDAGTVTSVLIPWNTCGATQSTVLGVATGDYFMYCFFNIISPLMTMLFGILNIKIRKVEKEEEA
jgi:NhaC family Na+:H+ antiporter